MNEAIVESAKRILLAVTLFVLVVGTGVAGWFVLFENNSTNSLAPRVARPQARKSVGFAYDVCARLAEGHAQDNFVFSPYALEMGLLMLRSAANEGTQAQLTKILYPGATEEQAREREEGMLSLRPSLSQLGIVNRLWVQRDFDLADAYLKASEKKFGLMPGLIEFRADVEAARLKINRWVFDRVGSVGENFLRQGAIDSLTNFLLTSVANFDAAWESQFRADQTEPAEFKLLTATAVSVPFMHSEETLQYAERPDYKVVEVPYEGEALSMLILLPKEVNGLPRIEANLTPEFLATALGALKPRKVALALPRFNLEKVMSLPIILNAMGMTEAFEPTRADFSKLTGRRDIYLNTVIHRSGISVKENGVRQADHSMAKLISDVGGRSVAFRAD
ncbi:MAG: hypothetical protein HY074_04620, partial [Deltaproteobacteria bacterium]|nr:hypothetical protein [Deltaproteobacteria bacterium]